METHLHHEHVESHLKSPDFLRDIVIGMSDGLTLSGMDDAGEMSQASQKFARAALRWASAAIFQVKRNRTIIKVK